MSVGVYHEGLCRRCCGRGDAIEDRPESKGFDCPLGGEKPVSLSEKAKLLQMLEAKYPLRSSSIYPISCK
jgi:hypothetical protein